MKLKQAALLVIGLLPLGIIAQPNTNKPQTPVPPTMPPGAMMTPAKPTSTEMPDKDKLSYAIGMFLGKSMTDQIKRGNVAVDTNTVLAAVNDYVGGKPTRMTYTEVTDVLKQLNVAMRAKQEAEAEAAKAKGDAFLAQYAKGAGVTTLSNGLEYKVIKDGTGPMPKEYDTVTVAYRGTLSDGTLFDETNNFTTPVKGRTIQGWSLILPLMKVGSKWQVAIPAALGYGPRGRPPTIPGNSVLIFDMELKSITPGAPTLPPISGASHQSYDFQGAKPSAPSAPVVSGEIIKVPSKAELDKGAKIEVIKAGQTNAVSAQ